MNISIFNLRSVYGLMNYEAIYYLEEINRMSTNEISNLLLLFSRENDMILFAEIEDNLKYESEDIRDYLQTLQYYVGDEWIFPHKKPTFLAYKKILWYKTLTIESIQKALSLNNLFRSVVLEKGDTVENSKYVFYVIETMDSQVLCIAVKSKKDFQNYIMPRITKFNKSLRIKNQLI